MEAVDIIVSGHLCLDMLPEMASVPLVALSTPGRLYETGALTLSTGGAVSNTGLALHQLGVNVRLMSNVGDDFIGQAIIDVIESYAPYLSELIHKRSGEPSSYTIVLSPEKVDRIFLHCTGTNRTFGADDVDYELLKQVKIFHLGYPALLPGLITNEGKALETIYQQARATGVVTSLDMALPDPKTLSGQVDWVGIFQRTLPYVDIFIPSIEEILFCLRRANTETWRGKLHDHLTYDYLSGLADELIGMGCAIAGFKLGEMGIYLKTADAGRIEQLERLELVPEQWANVQFWHPAFQVDVVGTTGAGDAAYAGFLTSLLRGKSPEEAVRMACAVGACNVEAPDATSGVRSWEATLARIDHGWAARPEKLF